MDTLARIIEKLANRSFFIRPVLDTYVGQFYSDDSIFFIPPEVDQIRRFKSILKMFGKVSDLKINFDKSEVAAIHVDDNELTSLAENLGCRPTNLPMRYLGLPLHYKRPTKQEFRLIIEKIAKRLEGWQKSLLSIGGRLQKLVSPIQFANLDEKRNSAQDSFFWNDVCKLLNFFFASTEFAIGDGRMINSWDSNWSEGRLKFTLPSLYSFSQQRSGTLVEFYQWVQETNLARALHIRNPLSNKAMQELSELQIKINSINFAESVD
ncbi:hypothetical protein LUZ60_017528 [Juncus effusus]|nr:hypothetical protein LUZ60_017528 [Juncus effusus]